MEAKLKSTHETFEAVALIVVAVLLILTSLGNAMVLFWASIVAMFGLFVWFLSNRKVWLATVSGLTFAITVVATASKLF